MPIVPTYGPRRVTTAPLPGVRKQAHETALSEGAGLAAAEGQRAEAMGNFGAVAANVGVQLWTEQQREADRTALTDAQNKLSRWETDRLHNPETGALNVKGKEAMGLGAQIDQEFDQVTGEIEQGLNKRQRLAFRGIKGTRAENLHARIEQHAAKEAEIYEVGEFNALLANSQDHAVSNASLIGGDPVSAQFGLRAIGTEIKGALDAIESHAKKFGYGPTRTEEEKSKYLTATHAAVIHQMLADDKAKAAQTYFADRKEAGEITGPAIAKIESALKEGTVRADAQKFTDQILADPKLDTLTKQQDKAKELASDRPELRDALNERLEHANTLRQRKEREDEESTLTKAYNILDSTADITRISPTVWASLPGSARTSLREYANHLAAGTSVQTDWATYYELQTLGSSEATRNDFAQTNLLKYRDRLGNAEFKHLTELQESIRKGDDKRTTALVASDGEQNSIVNDTLASIGLDPTQAAPGAATYNKFNSDRVIAFRRSFRDAVAAKEIQKGNKKLTTEEMQSIADTLVAPAGRRLQETHWYGDTSVPGFAFEQPQAQVTAATDVPTGERRRIEDALRRNGRPIVDAEVLRLFNLQLQMVRGDRGRR